MPRGSGGSAVRAGRIVMPGVAETSSRYYESTQAGNQLVIVPSDQGTAKRLLNPNIAQVEQARQWEAGAWVLTLSTKVDLSVPQTILAVGFVTPPPGGLVDIVSGPPLIIGTISFFVVGQRIDIGTAGIYTVIASDPDTFALTVQNTGASGNAPGGTAIAAGVAIFTLPLLNTLIAKIALGDGAVTTPIEVDIANGASLQFPCGYLQVDAFLEDPPIVFTPPLSQIVTATVHRGFSSAPSSRTFYAANDGAVGTLVDFVPVGSKSVRAWGLVLPPLIFTASQIAPSILVTYSAAQLAASQSSGIPLAVPAGAIFFDAVLGGIGILSVVEFQLHF